MPGSCGDRFLAKGDGRVGVTLGADAILAALQRYGGITRIGVVTLYLPVGDEKARQFFTECGFAAVRVKGLRCGSPVLIAHTSEAALRDAIIAVDGPDGSVSCRAFQAKYPDGQART